MLLIDSSAIVKYLSKESGWQEVIGYVSEAHTIPLALVEISNALLIKCKKKEISSNVAAELTEEYSRSAVLVDQDSQIANAFKIAFGNNLTIYDSLFLAVALRDGYDLVSCDRKQIKAAKDLGIKSLEV